jgi:hypothetical protein
MKEPMNLVGKKPIIRKPADNETLALNALMSISISLSILITENLGRFDQETDGCIRFCIERADETIVKIEGMDE